MPAPPESEFLSFFYENPAEYLAIYGGDECGGGATGTCPEAV
jgi:hypothetical protein